MILKISYYIQKNEKFLRIFIKKGLINTLSTGETVDFTGKNDPLIFL